MDAAKKVEASYISMIMPARWYAGGRGLDKFRDKMLSDTRISNITDYPDSTECFPGVDISGGICYFLWDKQYKGNCTIVSRKKNKISTAKRPLLEEGMDTFIRHNEALPVFHKVQERKEKSFDFLVSPQTPFGFISSFSGYKKDNFEGAIKYYSYGKNGYVSYSQIKRNAEWAQMHKVYLSAAYGERGSYPYFFLGKPFYGEVNSCCSQTYLMIGPFETKKICDNVIAYMSTRFFRFMIMLKKNAQHNMRNVFTAVPLQDFTENSDIDWSKSIPEIDKQLYAKYNLTEEEISFIESMIKPME